MPRGMMPPSPDVRINVPLGTSCRYATPSSSSSHTRGPSDPCGATIPYTLPSATRIRGATRSEEHTSELQSLRHLVCRLLLEKKKKKKKQTKRTHQKKSTVKRKHQSI